MHLADLHTSRALVCQGVWMTDAPDQALRLAFVERHERDSGPQIAEVVRAMPGDSGRVVATPTSVADTATTLRTAGLDVTPDAATAHVLTLGEGDPNWIVHTHADLGLHAYVGALDEIGTLSAATLIGAPTDFARLRADEQVDRNEIDAIHGYTEWSGCRAQAIAGFLRHELVDECGICDNCVTPPAGRVGATDAAQAVEAVVQTGERFSAKHLISVLLGERTETVEGQGHDRLDVWKSGSALTRAQWDAIYRQLLAIGVLAVNADGGIVTTPLAEAVRSGEREVRFIREMQLPDAPMPKRRGVAAKKATGEPAKRRVAAAPKRSTSARAIEEAKRGLYRWRATYAAELGVPAIRILTDPDISRLIVRRPTTMDELRRIVTPSRCDAYGEAILAALEKL